MNVGELKKLLETVPDDYELRNATEFAFSCAVPRIEVIHSRKVVMIKRL